MKKANLVVLGVVGAVAAWLLFFREKAPAGGAVLATTALAPLVATGHLEQVSARDTSGRLLSFVPGLLGNTLKWIFPRSIVNITVKRNMTVIVSGVTHSLVAGVPTDVRVGDAVTFAVG